MPILAPSGPTLVLPDTNIWPGISAMTWTGWDGSEWDLLGESGGVFLTPDGVRGMHMPQVDRQTIESPALAGSRWRGARTLERDVFWPLFLYVDSGSLDWLAYDRAFWATMDPLRLGTWSVTSADGQTRTLKCRFIDDSDHDMNSDPSMRGWDTYAIHMVAEQPYWVGEAITRTWSNVSSQPFFGGTGGSGFGPPFVISSGNTLGSAQMPNPGDVEAPLLWRIDGPSTTVSVGVAGNVATYAAAILDGHSVTIDTSPDRLTVVDQDGMDRTTNLTDANFASIPAGTSVPLTVSMAGTGRVTATIEPRHRRAW